MSIILIILALYFLSQNGYDDIAKTIFYIVVVIAVIAMIIGAKDDTKAHYNWTQYWKNGGPNQNKKNRHH